MSRYTHEQEDSESTGEAIGSARFIDTADASRFIWAGAAIVTLVSSKTGTRYTFRISRAKESRRQGEVPPYFIGLLTGPDNNDGYTYMGLVPGARPERLILTRASKYNDDTAPVKAFRYLLGALKAGTFGLVEVWHEGRCGRCGRRLTVPESLASGIGPVCVGLAA